MSGWGETEVSVNIVNSSSSPVNSVNGVNAVNIVNSGSSVNSLFHSINSSSNSSCSILGNIPLNDPEVIGSLVPLGLICLIVTLGNILVISAVRVSPKLRGATNYFIVSLACADLFLGVLVLPFSATLVVFDKWVFGRAWCSIWLAVDVWTCTASILMLVIISMDRYIAVTYPVTYPNIITTSRAKLLIAGAWILSFVICFPPLVGWNDTQEVGDLLPNGTYAVSANSTSDDSLRSGYYDNGECSPQCNVRSEKSYVIYSSVGSFFAPMVVMLFFNYKIYVTAKDTTKAIRQGFTKIKMDGQDMGAMGIHKGSSKPQMKRAASQPVSARNIRRSARSSSILESSYTQIPADGAGHGFSNGSAGPRLSTTSTMPCSMMPRLSTTSTIPDELDEKAFIELSQINDTTGPAQPSAAYRCRFHRSRGQNNRPSFSDQGTQTFRSSSCHKEKGSKAFFRTKRPGEHRPKLGRKSLGVRKNLYVFKSTKRSSCNTDSSEPPSPTSSIIVEGDGAACKSRRTSKSHFGKRNIKSQVRKFKMETKAAKTIGIIVSCFIICWLPFFISYLIQPFCDQCIPDILVQIFIWLGYCNSAINPFIYGFFSLEFRAAFKKIICRLICKGDSGRPEQRKLSGVDMRSLTINGRKLSSRIDL